MCDTKEQEKKTGKEKKRPETISRIKGIEGEVETGKKRNKQKSNKTKTKNTHMETETDPISAEVVM